MMNLILCGLPGSGKTTVGMILAQKLNWAFIDTDREIENLYANSLGICLSVREITKKEGLSFFQHLESQVVQKMKSKENCVIATGGATFLSSENRILTNFGTIIYLQATPRVLLPRVLRNGVPTYLNGDPSLEAFEKLAEFRHPIYQAVSHHTIHVDLLTPEEIAAKIDEFRL
jgi:shikimate kinase